MSSRRYCSLCDTLIEIETVRVRYVDHNGDSFVIDAAGRAHTLLSEKRTARRQRSLIGKIKPVTIVVPKVVPKADPAVATEVQVPQAPSEVSNISLAAPTEPTPTDWYRAKVRYNEIIKKYIAAELENGSSVFLHHFDLRQSPGSHLCHLKPGSELFVRIVVGTKGVYDYRAIEAIDESEVWATEETSVVHKWEGTFGSLNREDCGCPIFARSPEFEDFRPGDRIRHSVVKNERKGFVAENLEVWSKEHQ